MRIMTVSDSPTLFSGLARVHRNVIDALMERGHLVLPCGWFAYDPDTAGLVASKKMKPPQVWHESASGRTRVMDVPKKGNNLPMTAIWDIQNAFKPDIVLTIGDHWDFWYMKAIRQQANYSFKWLAYLTIENDDIEDQWKALMGYADVLVAPSQFGKRVMELATRRPALCVPYGVSGAFHRYPEDRRRQLREDRGCQDKVRFIMVGQNTTRKNIPALLQSIELLARRDPNKEMQFYIHTNVDAIGSAEASVYDLRRIVEKLGIGDWVTFPEEEQVSIFGSPPDERLAEEYNASDFFVSSSICEGFGLPMLEAMACGLPAIANATSTTHEHVGADPTATFGWAPRGCLVSNKVEVLPPANIIHVVRPEGLSEAIWEAFLAARGRVRLRVPSGQGMDLEGMRTKCIEYGKERTWGRMKDNIASITEALHGPVRLPVEIL